MDSGGGILCEERAFVNVEESREYGWSEWQETSGFATYAASV